jgi:hypothetical protein
MNKQLQEVNKVRQEIAAAHEELEWTMNSAIPPDELKARASKHCEAMEQKFEAARVLLSLANPGAGSAEAEELFRLHARIYIPGQSVGAQDGVGTIFNPAVTSANIDGVGSMLGWLAKDALITRLHEEIDRLDYRPGPPLADRPKLVAALKKSLAELEHREEVMIVAAEDAGHIIPRRPDADPAVVLGYDPAGQMAEDRTRVRKPFVGVLTE